MVPDPVGSEVFVLQKLLVTPISERSFCTRSFLRALPEFFRSWAKFSFCRDDADRKWLRLRSEVEKFYSVSETVTKVYRNGDAAPRFDGRHDAGHAVMFLDDARFLFHLRKGDREYIVVIRIVFAGEANQGFGSNLAQRNGAASGKRMLRSDRHADALAEQLLKPHIVKRTSLWGTSYQSELKPAIAYAVEYGFVAPIVQSDVHLWHRSPEIPVRFSAE